MCCTTLKKIFRLFLAELTIITFTGAFGADLPCPLALPCECANNTTKVDCAYKNLRHSSQFDFLQTHAVITTFNVSGNSFAPNDTDWRFMDYITGIKVLDASFSDLYALPSQWLNLDQLEDLRLRGNHIDANGFSFVGISQLKHLDLSGNRMRAITRNTLKHLNDLITLNLSSSGLEIIGEGTFFSTAKLEVLILSYNSLKLIHAGMFYGLRPLKYLELVRSNVTQIPSGVLSVLGNLESLTLSTEANQIDSHILSGLSSIEIIRYTCEVRHMEETRSDQLLPAYQDTQLDYVGVTGCRLPHLRTGWIGSDYSVSYLSDLMLPNNEITSIDWDFFSQFESLVVLDLTDNPIKVLPNFDTPMILDELLLAGSNVEQIYPCEMKGLEGLQILDLTAAPLRCDCSTLDLKKFHEDLHKSAETHWRCASPPSHLGEYIDSVDVSEFTCSGSQKKPPYCHSDHQRAISVYMRIESEEGNYCITLNNNMLEMTETGGQPKIKLVWFPTHSPTEEIVKELGNKSVALDLTDLMSDTDYTICVELTNDDYLFATNCTQFHVAELDDEHGAGSDATGDTDSNTDGFHWSQQVQFPLKYLLIGGGIAGLLIFILLVTSIVCCARKRAKKKSFDPPQLPLEMRNNAMLAQNNYGYQTEIPREGGKLDISDGGDGYRGNDYRKDSYHGDQGGDYHDDVRKRSCGESPIYGNVEHAISQQTEVKI